jgi:hypothetical protein
MQGASVRVAAAGFLALVMLSALGPSMAAAVEAAEDQAAPAARLKEIEPASEPEPPEGPPPQAQPPQAQPPQAQPPQAQPPQAQPPHPTQKPKPAPTPKPKPKPPKPTPPRQSPGQRPGGQAPGDPDPVRPAEPPAAPVVPEPEAAEPPGPAGPPGGGAGSNPTGPVAGVGRPLSRVHLVVAGATVSGIAAVAGWLVLGGRRREWPNERPAERIPLPTATTVTLADGMQLDLEVVVNRADGAPQPRYSGRGPAAATTLWRDEDDRPRWVQRFDEQGPARPRGPRSSVGIEDRDEDLTGR